MIRVLSMMLLAAACALAISAPALAGKFTLLHTFQGGKDGQNPVAALTPDGQGGFYGTTGQGGGSKACSNGCGTVFHIGPDGSESVLYSFAGRTDGASPDASVTIGPDGALYGTTFSGGGTGCGGFGCGTVYRLTMGGQESVLHAFEGVPDGALPKGEVIFDRKGNLYGTTFEGGNPAGQTGNGTVFRISSKGKESILYAFADQPDAAAPVGTLVFDKAGNLYGTSADGGSARQGTVFKLTPEGSESVLYSFQGSGNGKTDGRLPNGNLIIDKAGSLYGTTQWGGADNVGTVFMVTSSGVETVLHSFFLSLHGSGIPYGGVIAESGNLYGTTSDDGDDTVGQVYQLAPDGTFTVLHAFGKSKKGTHPHATVTSDGLGNLYGTTMWGGRVRGPCDFGCGTVYRIEQ